MVEFISLLHLPKTDKQVGFSADWHFFRKLFFSLRLELKNLINKQYLRCIATRNARGFEEFLQCIKFQEALQSSTPDEW